MHESLIRVLGQGLFQDVAAMHGVGIGQRLVDRLHRSGWQPGGQQAVA